MNDKVMSMLDYMVGASYKKKVNGKRVSDHVYVVGGAVRDYLLGKEIKDIDVVIDAVSLGGFNSSDFANYLSRESGNRIHTEYNNYGVAICTVIAPFMLEDKETGEQIDVKGEVVEIANARTESYGGKAGKGYKPSEVNIASIDDDAKRREFTLNTLMWRFTDLFEKGIEGAPIVDPTKRGLQDLRSGLLKTPSEPNKTFQDDPTRILRTVKFILRNGWKVDDNTLSAIKASVDFLKNVPQNALFSILAKNILPYGGKSIDVMYELGIMNSLLDIYSNDEEFRVSINNFIATEIDPYLAIEIYESGFPCNLPWRPPEDNDGSMVRELNQSIKRTKGKIDPNIFISAIRQPTKLAQDKIWVPSLLKRYNLQKRDIKNLISNISSKAFKIAVIEPSILANPEDFKAEIELYLDENFS